MEALVHIFFFLFSSAVVWFFAGLLIESVHRIAKRFHRTGFTVAFFILGLLTSISEISVTTSSILEGVPQISVGNLVGASFVILLFLIPFLAVVGRGIQTNHTLSRRNLLLALLTITLPVFCVIDGDVTPREGLLALLTYVTLLFAVRGQKDSIREVELIEKNIKEKTKAWTDLAQVLVGGIFIFIAGHFLVEQAIYFAGLLDVPNSLIGLLLLSIGTNVPEIVIAGRAILKRHKDIAFGDYIGSAATNTLIFGVLSIASGRFRVEASEFVATALLMVVGFTFFFFFTQSKNKISRREALVLLSFYAVFLFIQIWNIFRFAEAG